jgi:hypothetical protein
MLLTLGARLFGAQRERGPGPGRPARREQRVRHRILTRLQLRDRVQPVVLAYETGLVSVGQNNEPGGISR